MTSEKHHYNLLALLPYSDEAQLINKHQKLSDLYFIKSIADICLMALNHFVTGKLSLFDAQVGENLCQIRAYGILCLSYKYLSSTSSKDFIFKEIAKFEIYKKALERAVILWETAIEKAVAYDKNLDGTEFISDFLERQHLNFEITEDIVFIITCFFLTHFAVRTEEIPIAINLNFISRELHISKYRAKRLTHKYQLLVCKLGCDFVVNIAKELPHQNGYLKLLEKLYQISDEDRTVLPCYMASEIVFYHAISKNRSIFFVIKMIGGDEAIERVIYFTLLGHKNELKFLLEPECEYFDEACLVVSGVVYLSENNETIVKKYVKHILTETPLRLILANTASHPQYSGKLLENFKVNPFLIVSDGDGLEQKIKSYYEEKLLNMQDFAIKEGCSKKNPTTFLLKHIYASKVIEEICLLKQIGKGRVYSASEYLDMETL